MIASSLIALTTRSREIKEAVRALEGIMVKDLMALLGRVRVVCNSRVYAGSTKTMRGHSDG
ncbi:MAG TPA: hypothetical protein VI296_00650 [Candidatus Dormibacteraeota bacterium]